MKNNFIEEYKNVLSAKTCKSLIEAFNTHSDLASEGAVGNGRVLKDIKSSLDINWLQNGVLGKEQYESVLSEMRDILDVKVEEYFKKYTMESNGENQDDESYAEEAIWKRYVINHGGIHMKKYSNSLDHYSYHEDSGAGSINHFSRKLVMMFYLNDVKSGGETEFKFQGVKIKPTTGTLVIFPAGFTGRHRGNPPLSGEKYIINTWLLRVVPPLAEYLNENENKFYLPKK